ncbi:GNAT family N-acetyltransferase [Palleronia caenipelagi]|uniref:GNAT family N-acetyltransferase n=1 Tax=Palleronia caenipelagi TaxID=2489174 RepID=A0A547Q5A4_9RHOB|nr:GNAT family N-acetyltransferase [Palleronia caenipelagi]TRD21543.1 GNAT family N-acetyltransferase [Palleronia caenipelagi]
MTPEALSNAELAAIHARAMRVPKPWSEAEIASLRAAPGILCLTAGRSFAMGRVVLDEAELLTIAVDPDHQGKGIGRELLDAYHRRAHANGATVSFLEVAETNVPARALYYAAEYIQCGLRKGYYTDVQPPVDALVLRRPLPA